MLYVEMKIKIDRKTYPSGEPCTHECKNNLWPRYECISFRNIKNKSHMLKKQRQIVW